MLRAFEMWEKGGLLLIRWDFLPTSQNQACNFFSFYIYEKRVCLRFLFLRLKYAKHDKLENEKTLLDYGIFKDCCITLFFQEPDENEDEDVWNSTMNFWVTVLPSTHPSLQVPKRAAKVGCRCIDLKQKKTRVS